MPKLLFLCRHAEAEDQFTGHSDFNRCLTASGITQAIDTSIWLQYRFAPELIIASPAERTWQTARLLAATLNFSPDIILLKPELYNAPSGIITTIASQLPDTVQQIVLVGHNPGITKALEELTNRQTGFLNPGSVGVISFEVATWQQTLVEPGNLVEIFTPRKV